MSKKIFSILFLLLSISSLYAQLPTLGTYAATTIATASSNSMVIPSIAPSNATSITASTSANFKGLLLVNPSTGVVTIINAQPAGTYTVTVKAFNGVTNSFTTFPLTVGNAICSVGQLTNTGDLVVGSVPYDVVVGDFNNDGKQDIAVANRSSNTVSIRLGNGAGAFTGTTEVPVGPAQTAMAVNDFNGDGNLDLAIANNSNNKVSIKLGNGAGNFSGTTEVSVGAEPRTIVAADFNNDGKQDFATVGIVANAVSIRLGDGTGLFSATAEISVGLAPASMVVCDFNGDGNTDFATADNSGNSISIRLGNGTGGFVASTSISGISGPTCLANGDFNGDGNMDLAIVRNSFPSSIAIRLGDGAGGFVAAQDVMPPANPTAISAGDFNGDGKQDLATVNSNSTLSICTGNGTAGFVNVSNIALSASSMYFAFGDFNGDGRHDFVVPNNYSSSTITVFSGYDKEINVTGNNNQILDGATLPSLANHTDFGNIDDTLSRTFTIQSTGLRPIIVGSINIAGTDSSAFAVSGITLPVTINNGTSATFKVTFAPSTVGLNKAVVRINNNDCDEAVYDFVVQGNAVAVPVALGNYPDTLIIATPSSNGLLMPAIAPNNAISLSAIARSDFKGTIYANPITGKITVINAHPAGTYLVQLKGVHGVSSDTTSFVLIVKNANCSQAQFTVGGTITYSGIPAAFAIGDFNNDGKQDLLTANQNTNTVSLNVGNGTTGFAASTSTAIGNYPSAIVVGDFNNDGNQDFATANNMDSSLSIRMGNGAGIFTSAANVRVGSIPSSLAMGDFNSDGNQDLVTANEVGTYSLRFGDGKGGFTGSTNRAAGFIPKLIAVGDFNNDGKADLAIGSYYYVSINLGDGTGMFTQVAQLSYGTTPFSVLIADLNKDGNQDMVVTDNGSKTFIRMGNGSGGFGATIPITVPAAPGNTAIGDFNGDGNLDIAVACGYDSENASITLLIGNGLGAFTPTVAIPASGGPKQMVVGDFNSDGLQDIISWDASVNIRLNTLTDIDVVGNGLSIPDGNATATATNHTDFGATKLTVLRTFTIKNTSTVKLTVRSIYSSGADSSMFTIGGIALPITLAANTTTTFKVGFVPGGPGIRTANINIVSDDCDETLYDFAVQGTGIVSATLGAYTATTVKTGGNVMVAPSSAPTNATSITARTSSNFKGILHVDPTTGVVNITNAQPPGTYTITVGDPAATSSFMLTVDNGSCSQGLFGDSSNINFPNGSGAVAVGDFNNDGKQDMVVSQLYPGDSTYILLNNGAGGFTTTFRQRVGIAVYSLVTADFNGDGKLDYAAASETGLYVGLGNGLGGVVSRTDYNIGNTGGGFHNIAIGDFNGDGRPDICAGDYSSPNLYIRINDGAGGFSTLTTILTGGVRLGPVAVADFNNDNKQDIVVCTYNGSNMYVMLGDGTGYFIRSGSYFANSSVVAVSTGDFNRDNKMDVAVIGANTSYVSILLNGGNGVFPDPIQVPVQNGTRGLAIGDINGDGFLDLATANLNSNSVSIRFGNGNGAFAGNLNLPTAAAPPDLALADFNQDGKIDMAVASSTSKNFTIRLGTNTEIDLLGNGIGISDGSNVTDTANFTNFGNIAIGDSLSKTFVVQNNGTDVLRLDSIKINGAGASFFSLNGIALPTTLAPGTFKNFNIRFLGTMVGTRIARVNIYNNDCDEAIYDFAIQGKASCAVLSADNIWLGITPNWADASNWSLGTVPDGCGKAVVNTGVPFMPQISIPNATCYSLTLNNGATFTVLTGGHLTITGP